MKRATSLSGVVDLSIDRNIDSKYDKVATVSDNIDKVTKVADILGVDRTNFDIVAGMSAAVVAVGSNADKVVSVANDLTNINSVQADLGNINVVAADISNVHKVGVDIHNVDTVATNIGQIDTVVTSIVPNLAEILLADTNAQTATTKASEASVSAANALSSKNAASASASSAAASATSAHTSEVNAATSAAASAGSATVANTKAMEAGMSAAGADTSMQTAVVKASEAAVSANSAQVSATQAGVSASTAFSAQVAAQAALDAIKGSYLGTQSSDPLVDLLGNPVNSGDWYYNGVSNVTRIYANNRWNNGAVDTSSFVLSGEIGVTVQPYDAATTKAANTQTLTNKTVDDITNHVGANHVHYKVKAGSNLAVGNVVKSIGYNSGEDAIIVDKVTSSNDIAIGIVENAIALNAFGLVTVSGVLEGIDTSSYTVGTLLYTNANGMLSSTKPNQEYVQTCGYVLRVQSNNGSILVDFTAPSVNTDYYNVSALII